MSKSRRQFGQVKKNNEPINQDILKELPEALDGLLFDKAGHLVAGRGYLCFFCDNVLRRGLTGFLCENSGCLAYLYPTHLCHKIIYYPKEEKNNEQRRYAVHNDNGSINSTNCNNVNNNNRGDVNVGFKKNVRSRNRRRKSRKNSPSKKTGKRTKRKHKVMATKLKHGAKNKRTRRTNKRGEKK